MAHSKASAELTLEAARIRLEGAVERLEAIAPELEAARARLDSPRWRTDLSRAPELLEGLARAAPGLEEDLSSARRLLARAPCPALSEQVERVTRARETLAGLAKAHAGSSDAPLDVLLRAAHLQALQELPRPLEPDEHVVSTHRAGWRGRLRSRASRNTTGTVVLTTQRILYRPGRADPQEVRLADLFPGTLRVRPLFETIQLSTPRALRLSWVERGAELGAKIELERWLFQGHPAPPDAPRFQCVLLPFYLGEPQGVASAYSLVLAPSGFAVLPVTPHLDLRHRLGTLVGAVPQVAISLEQLLPALQRMEPVQAERALDVLAKGMGTSFRAERRLLRQPGYTNRIGLDRGDRVFWVEPATFELAMQVRTCTAGWAEEERTSPS